MSETHQKLQEAVEKKDAALVKQLAVDIRPMTKEALAIPAPQGEEDKKTWASQIEYVKSVELYSEYALYATAVASPPAVMVDLIATLEKENPKSKYLDQAYSYYIYALNQTGASAKIPAMAEEALKNFPENEDLLLFMTDNALGRKQEDRALNFANRLVAAANKHTKPPEGVPAADFEKKRSASLARGYWVSGVISGGRNQYAAADRNLRAALPLVQSNPAMAGPALYFLGVANYNIAKMTNNKPKMLEAVKFSDQAAAIAGPYQEQAYHNSAVMKKEAAAMR